MEYAVKSLIWLWRTCLRWRRPGRQPQFGGLTFYVLTTGQWYIPPPIHILSVTKIFFKTQKIHPQLLPPWLWMSYCLHFNWTRYRRRPRSPWFLRMSNEGQILIPQLLHTIRHLQSEGWRRRRHWRNPLGHWGDFPTPDLLKFRKWHHKKSPTKRKHCLSRPSFSRMLDFDKCRMKHSSPGL